MIKVQWKKKNVKNIVPNFIIFLVSCEEWYKSYFWFININ